MVATVAGSGYDFIAGDGGIFSFGDARFYGSTGGIHVNQPVVGMTSTPDGRGYWLVATDGGIFSFGDARFYGSTGGTRLAQPVVGMAHDAKGQGYWLVAADGGIFPFGSARFHGSGVGHTGGSPAVGLVATGDGGGYWIVLANGRILAEGDAPSFSGPTSAPAAPAGSASAPSPDHNYTFEVTGASGVPARWNPCETIPYAVVDTGAPAGWRADVANDIAQVSAATRLSFVNDGVYSSPSQVPSSAKVTVSWVRALSRGDYIGFTGYSYVLVAGYAPQLVSAQIQLLSSLPAGGGRGEQPVLLHELGHAVGLGHTPGSGEVMNPVAGGIGSYQLGDLNGLWRVGATQGCANFFK
jgi:hypothetical protein